jgi:hypothetical protein
MLKPIFRLLAVCVAGIVLSSCSSDKQIEFCPGITSVLDAYMAVTFKPGAPALPANALYTVNIVKAGGKCSFDKQGKTSDSSVTIKFAASRATPGDAAQYTVPYFVAVTEGENIITKTVRNVTFSFAAGEKTATFEDDVDSVSLITDGEKKPYDYQILVGLQLTKEQLDYNRSIGIFAR